MEDHYATLQVRPTATAEEIERAYRRLARANHPDLLREVGPEARRRAEERLKRINGAHGVLGDRERRRAYDRERSGAAPASRAQPRPPHQPRPPAPRPPAAARTSHWGAGGPIDIEWSAPPPRAPRPDTDIFSTRRLIRYAAAIVLFAALLAILWRPGLDRRVAPTATLPAVATPTIDPISTIPARPAGP